MTKYVPKSRFKPKAFEYFRLVEREHAEIIITDHGRPVLKLIPFSQAEDDELRALRGLVERYKDPLEPVEVSWEASD